MGNKEELESGQISTTDAEIEQVRAKAKLHGEDPDAAEAAFREKIKKANDRFQGEHSDKAVKGLEDEFKKAFN
jgi:hypothetical protein